MAVTDSPTDEMGQDISQDEKRFHTLQEKDMPLPNAVVVYHTQTIRVPTSKGEKDLTLVALNPQLVPDGTPIIWMSVEMFKKVYD